MIKKITSLCIPRIETSITKEYILNIFQNQIINLPDIDSGNPIPNQSDR